MREIHPLVFGVFASLLLIPAFFWVGGKLVHLRIDTPPLILAAGIVIIYFIFRKR